MKKTPAFEIFFQIFLMLLLRPLCAGGRILFFGCFPDGTVAILPVLLDFFSFPAFPLSEMSSPVLSPDSGAAQALISHFLTILASVF